MRNYKLISLNTWCGVKFENLKEFIIQQSSDTDIFCLQEVRNGKYLSNYIGELEKEDLFSEIKKMLPDFSSYFLENTTGVGLALFVKNDIAVEKVENDVIISAEELEDFKMESGNSYYPRVIQSLFLRDSNLVIYNFHGLPGNDKKDHFKRDLQTDRVLEIMSKNNSKKIIVGDFNLDINTNSISRMETGLENLIKKYNIKTTRNNYYDKIEKLPFADYALVSRDLLINDFGTFSNEVSDHLPLFLKFSI